MRGYVFKRAGNDVMRPLNVDVGTSSRLSLELLHPVTIAPSLLLIGSFAGLMISQRYE
jgi:hypothetical protein